MEAMLVDCVRNSLSHFVYKNAIFMCERLCAEFPSEVITSSFHSLSMEINWVTFGCVIQSSVLEFFEIDFGFLSFYPPLIQDLYCLFRWSIRRWKFDFYLFEFGISTSDLVSFYLLALDLSPQCFDFLLCYFVIPKLSNCITFKLGFIQLPIC